MGLFTPKAVFMTITFVFICSSQFSNFAEAHPNKNIQRGQRKFGESFVPIHPIPETNRFTGIYYKIGLQRFPFGWVTWTETKNEAGGWNYVQIDSRSDHTSNYEKSGPWYNDIQWFFTPSETEPGWYNLRNRQVPEALATWSKSEHTDESAQDHGRHIILNRNADPNHADSLWKPVQQSIDKLKELELTVSNNNSSGHFQLRIKSLPEGTVTWTWKEYEGTDSHYIQVDDDPNNLNNYKIGNDWYEDTLFRFDNLETELVGEITQLEMQLFPKLDETRSLTITDCENVPSTIFVNIESDPISREVKQDFLSIGELDLKLHGSLAQLPNVMKIKASGGQVSPPWYADSVEFQTIKEEVYSNEEIKLKTFEHGGVNTNVMIPAWSTTEIRVCKEYIDTSQSQGNVDVGVYVFLEISEKSFRPSLNSGKRFEAVYTKLPAEEFAHRKVEGLINAGKMDIDERWGLPGVGGGVKQSVGMEFEETGLKILGSRESEVLVIAQGSINGKFGFRGIVASN